MTHSFLISIFRLLGFAALLFIGSLPFILKLQMSLFASLVLYPLVMITGLGVFALIEQLLVKLIADFHSRQYRRDYWFVCCLGFPCCSVSS